MFLRIVTLLSCLILSISHPSDAHIWYLRASGGYAFPVSLGRELQLDGYPHSGSYPTTPGMFIHFQEGSSLTAGVWAGLNAGFQFRENLALELGFDQALQTQRYEYANKIPGPDRSTTTVRVNAASPRLLAISGVWTYHNALEGFYLRLGAVIPLSRQIRSVSTTRTDSNIFNDYRTYDTKFSLGVRAALGYSMPLTTRISVNAEASFLGMALQATEARLTESTFNGADRLADKTERERRVIYTRSFLESFSPDPNQAGQLPGYRIPFSNLSFNVGLTFALAR